MLPPAIRGIVVGFANTLVIALCIAILGRENRATDLDTHICMFFVVIAMGLIPGALVGSGIAMIAHALSGLVPRYVNLAFMIWLACGAVWFFGSLFQMNHLIARACIPTIVACWVLERWMQVKAAPRLPSAIAR